MKAIQFTGANKLEVKDVNLPEVKEGYGLIKVSHCGICGTDLNIYAGTHPRAKAPLTMGHEFSGVMANDVGELKKGMRVTAYPLISCMNCTPCNEGNKHVCNTLKLFGIDCDGGMAEYVAIPADQIVKLPDDISDEVGALIEPIAVAVHTLRETHFTPGDNAIIFGCGTIGLCLALTLRQFGAGDMVLVDTDDTRVNLAKELGFEAINPLKEDIYEITANKTNGDGFDRVFDCAGVQAVASCLLDVVKVRGKIVIVASYKKPTELPLFKGMAKELSIEFVRVYRQKDFEIAAKMAVNEPLFSKVITHILPADEAQKGFDLLLTKGTGAIKVMFKF